jgi:hypothetical protein
MMRTRNSDSDKSGYLIRWRRRQRFSWRLWFDALLMFPRDPWSGSLWLPHSELRLDETLAAAWRYFYMWCRRWDGSRRWLGGKCEEAGFLASYASSLLRSQFFDPHIDVDALFCFCLVFTPLLQAGSLVFVRYRWRYQSKSRDIRQFI